MSNYPPYLGHKQQFKVNRLTEIGAYIDGGDTEILVPVKYLPQGIRPDDMLDVFIYHDNEGRLIGTTLSPLIEVGEVAALNCVSVTNHGAFMEWGIQRDLFVPFAEQSDEIVEGRKYLVYAYIDEVSGKVVGSTKLSKHLGNLPPQYNPGDKVSGVVYGRNDFGYRVVVDNKHWGMIYYSEDAVNYHHGDRVELYVVRLREDGRIDLSIKPVGLKRITNSADKLLDLLKKKKRLPIGDKSDPQEIRKQTGLSKKAFKMAAGILYKERLIKIGPDSIELV